MRAEGPRAIISVRDNGIGIPAADLSRIFDMFVQLDASKTQAAAGLGLGLALARSLISSRRGDQGARSAGPGQGSEFAVHLPLVDRARSRCYRRGRRAIGAGEPAGSRRG